MSVSASSRAAVPPFYAMEMARDAAKLAASGARVVRFDVGQPAEGAPASAIAAAAKAMQRDPLGYTEGLGAPALRRAIADWYGHTHDLDIDPGRIVITTGASGGFVLAFLALLESGSRVAMAAPGYPPYRHILTALGFAAAAADCSGAPDLQLGPGDILRLGLEAPLAAVLTASPANPTGAMLSRETLAEIAAVTRGMGAALISDEIYHGLSYGPPATSALTADPDAIVVSSFSKYWAMTGWRVGWIVVPDALVKPVERLAQSLFISAPAISQAAALGALMAEDECRARLARYAAARTLLLDAAPGLGLPLAAPADGAFYMLLDVARFGLDSMAFCRRALAEAGVALTPGVDFCDVHGGRWVRLAYCCGPEAAAQGVEALGQWLDRL